MSPDLVAPSAVLATMAAARSLADELAATADGLEAAASAIPGPTSGWSGPAAAVLARLLATRPEQFRTAGGACRAAADALARHADALGPVLALTRQAEQAPGELAAGLHRRAAGLGDESAQQVTAVLLALAGSAPAPDPNRWQKLDSWRAELQLGAAEATESLAGAALKIAARLASPFRTRDQDDARAVVDVAVSAARHPVETAQALVDWDTWRANPARALGHLFPDAVAAIASGGTAAGVRATSMAGRTRAALTMAAARDGLRREVTGAAARAARKKLIDQAQAEALEQIRLRLRSAGAPRAGDLAWRGPGGAALTPLQNLGAEIFHRLSTARESGVTAAMHEASQAGGGRLAGLDHRVKELESHKRKLSTEVATTGARLPDLLAGAKDAMRYTVVIGEAGYVRAVADIAAALERLGFVAGPPKNLWHSPRYRGINSTWVDPRTGATFEVQFHTPASWRATEVTHPMYEEYRLADTPPKRRAELSELIAAEYRKAPIPGWVESVRAESFPPPTPPDPIAPPVDYTVHATAIGGTAAGLVNAGQRVVDP